jgi:hypothetical protein
MEYPTMHLKTFVRNTALGLGLATCLIGATQVTPAAHAQSATITTRQVLHAKCVYEEGICVWYLYHTLEVDGTGFSPGGEVVVYLKDGQSGVSLRHPQITASAAGTVALDTGSPWCMADGWRVKAFDVAHAHFTSTITVAPCTAP